MNSHAPDPEVLIIGAGIGGLVLALCLHRAGVSCRVFESAGTIRPLGVGINLLPHATRVLAGLGLERWLAERCVTTREACFFNRHGQRIYAEPAGRYAGHEYPQFSIHRGDLQAVLLEAVRERLGLDAVQTGHRCTRIEQDAQGVTVHFVDNPRLSPPTPARGRIVVGCDGIHSAVRKQLYPDEGPPRYSGVNMWRGVTPSPPFLSGASMVRAGWLSEGKMVIYPIRNYIDAEGRQLINWVAELESPEPAFQDWGQPGKLEDFFPAFADWHFDWLDVAGLIHGTDQVLAYPMVDREPLPRWSFERITLLGDAAHPMVPRGSNGAGQAILDAECLAQQCYPFGAGPAALEAYERIRVDATRQVVLMNRSNPPDAIIRLVHERTGGRPFDKLDDVLRPGEAEAISNRYKEAVGLKLGGED